IGSLASFERKLSAAQNDLGVPVTERVPVSFTKDSDSRLAISLSHSLVFVAAILIMLRGLSKAGGPGILRQLSDSKFKEVHPQTVKTRFADVAGCDEAKLEITEFVEFLKNPDKFKELGARIPKGALLVGPPGTGKTLLAKATAGEAGVPFFSVSGSDFVEMFAGLGARRVRALFQKARQKAPTIIFIDEIDAIGRKRDTRGHRPGGHDERENTLNQLLVEMDGFSAGENVIVLAATNREDILDHALLRPGRFDRKVHVGLPEIKGRRDILLVHMKGLAIAGELEEWARKLATLTPGMSGAELANICNEAALIAAREHLTTIGLRHFEAAIERVIAGLEKKTRLMSPIEKKTVAYHEAGHAIVGWFLQFADPLLKVSIVPRGNALGYAQLQGRDKNLLHEQEILDKVCMALGGRAAEELTFGEITNGASDDLSRVTQMAYRCITHWGFNPAVGHLSFPEMESYQVERPYSEHTSRVIDLQVREYVDNAYQRTKGLLRERSHELETIAQMLLEREVISRQDMEEALGKRPWNQKTSWEELTEQ
ncbi:MAG: ATP-dependent zinc metalloprotease FtsH, partial [archaeon]|nr:ATP-dependent zinc metalloprotease FtsH [archaeon]